MVQDITNLSELRLPWAGKQVRMESVEDELARLWHMSADNVRSSQNIHVRTSVLNLIICVPDIESAQQANALLRDLSSTHIGRVTILILDSSAPDRVVPWVTIRSFPMISDVMRHSFEQITVMAHGSAVRSIANIIQPVLKPELPVYLWWLNDPPSQHGLFDSLVNLSSRIIVDSSSFLTPEKSICTLASLLQEAPEAALSDLNWGRITPWRELVAQFFDTAEYMPYLSGLHHIEIEHAVAPFAVPTRTEQGDVSPNSTCALLLAGWLKTRLGWQLPADEDNSSTQHDPATGTHSWLLIRTSGPLSTHAPGTTASKAGKQEDQSYVRFHIRPRIQSDVRPGSLCMVRLNSIVGDKRAVFTIDREDDDAEHVLTSVELAEGTRLQRTVSMAATRKVSELLHDELEILSRDHLYEQTLEEVLKLLP